MDGSRTTFWDLYSHSYDVIRFAIPYRRLLTALTDALDLRPGMRVLDLGCGTGNLEEHLAAARPGVAVTGLDSSESMLRRARRKCANAPSVDFVAADLSRPLPFPNATFDRVVANNVLYALPERAAALTEAARVLRPGGLLVVSDPKAGARMGELIRAHFREIAAMPLLRRLALFAQSCVVLPLMGLTPILLITARVASRTRAGDYRFSTNAEMTALLQGFDSVEVGETYADQNWLVVAHAPSVPERRTASSATSSVSSLPANDSTSS